MKTYWSKNPLHFKELQRENARLKRMLADEMLGKELLKEALEKKL